MRVGFILPDLRGGGAERVNLDLAKEFHKRGLTVTFFLCHADGEFLEEASNYFAIEDLRCTRLSALPSRLLDPIRKASLDASIAAMWPLTCYGAVACKLSNPRMRVLVSEHNRLSSQYSGKGPLHRAWLRASAYVGYRAADARVGVSNDVAQDMAQLSAMNSCHFDVINNPVSIQRCSVINDDFDVEQVWGVKRGRRLLTVGSLKKQKNQKLLIDAFSQIANEVDRLVILGEGPMRCELERFAEEKKVASQIFFAGFKSDVRPYYETADLFVLSSDFEGFGNVIVEALAAGLPVVSTREGGPAEIVNSENLGRLVQSGDARALGKAVEQVSQITFDKTILKKRADDFSAAKAADAYLRLVER